MYTEELVRLGVYPRTKDTRTIDVHTDSSKNPIIYQKVKTVKTISNVPALEKRMKDSTVPRARWLEGVGVKAGESREASTLPEVGVIILYAPGVGGEGRDSISNVNSCLGLCWLPRYSQVTSMIHKHGSALYKWIYRQVKTKEWYQF